MDGEILDRARQLPPIGLEEMSCIKLMNRTDTKFVATLEQLYHFLSSVQGQYFIQEIEGKRVASYHTTYFDTPDNDMYLMHHNQRSVREKIRVRTYLDSDLTFLEVKNKNNRGRTSKKRIAVSALDHLTQEYDQVEPFLDRYAWYRLEAIRPVIENRFSRITLVNFNKTERLTVDFDLVFRHLITDCTREFSNVVILELKRDGNVPSPSLDIIRNLRIRRSGFSKYCMGCAFTNNELKRNNFKVRLNNIERIESNIITQ